MIEPESLSPRLVLATALLGTLLLVAGHSHAIEMCFVPHDWLGQWNATVDCDSLNAVAHPHAWLGYAEFTTPCGAGECLDLDYRWAISASDTDPHVQSGPLPRPTAELHVWLTCTAAFGGWDWAEFGVVTTGADIVSFEPRNGVQNTGTATDLHLVAPGGCPEEPFLAGTWTLDTGATSAPETWGGTWGRVKVLYR